MPNTSIEEDAKKAFLAFVDAMNSWETKHYSVILPLMEQGNAAMDKMKLAKLELTKLFEEYLEPGHCDRRRIDAGGIHSPPTYDSRRDDIAIETSKPSKVVLTYQQKEGPKSRLRFTITLSHGKWLIHKAEIFDPGRAKWLGFVI